MRDVRMEIPVDIERRPRVYTFLVKSDELNGYIEQMREGYGSYSAFFRSCIIDRMEGRGGGVRYIEEMYTRRTIERIARGKNIKRDFRTKEQRLRDSQTVPIVKELKVVFEKRRSR